MTTDVSGDGLEILPRLRRYFSPRFLKGALGLVIVFVLWWVSVPLVNLPDFFYPSPVAVWEAFIDLVRKGVLPAYILDSLIRYAAAVVIATVTGVSIGLLIALNKKVARALEPLVYFLYSLVEIAWIPIFILWFGFGFTTILLTIVYVVIWPIIFNAIVGVRSLPTFYEQAARSLGASRWQIITNVILPGVLAHLLTGFRIAAGFAFRALILGEIFAAESGIGFMIFDSAANLRTAQTIVGMIVMGLLWLFVDNVYLKPFELATVHRWGLLEEANGRE
jgi:ABC-type nitrate/sulfonate/bicarbonate transport system permease component